ncbi:MAG: MBL fold metallo-hydrolase, partial [Gemmatimonadaceae bacterium]
MTLRVVSHGDVTQIVMSTVIGRSIGYDVSAFLVRGVLIDLGFPLAARDLRRYLADARPDGALVTHHHEDHGGNAELVARLGVPLGASD